MDKKRHVSALQFASVLEYWKRLQVEIIKAAPSDDISKKIVGQISTCGASLALRRYFDDGQISSRSFRTCQKRLVCPLCAKRLARKNAFELCEKLKAFSDDSFQLVTITQSGHENLNLATDSMRETHRSFMKAYRNSKNRGTDETFFTHYSGGYMSLEVKKGKGSKLWHPHIHYLMHGRGELTSTYASKALHPLSIELSQRNPLNGYICDVRDVKRDSDGSLMSALFEVCKYVHDFKSSPNDVWAILQKLRGFRSRGAFGDMRGIKLSKDCNDLMDEDDVRDFVEYVLRFENNDYHIKSKTICSP